MLGEWTIRTVQPLQLLVLARFLTPADFGIVGVATIIIGLSQILQDFGAGKALIQTRDDFGTHANNAFWINFGVALLVYGGVVIFAAPISGFFQSPDSVPILRVLGCQVILASPLSIQAALLQRQIKFKPLFFIRLAPALVNGGLAITLAVMGWGVWALVWSTLASTILQLLLYWRTTRWLPRCGFDPVGFRRLFTFSRWVLFEALLAWVINWGDSVALGHFVGPEALGLYRMGSVVIIYISNMVFTPLVPVALSVLSRLQDDRATFTDCLGQITRIVHLLAVPIGVGLTLVAQPVLATILGPAWAGAGIVVQLMGARMALGWLVGMNSTAFTAAGRPDVNVRTLLVGIFVAVPTYLLAAPHGLLVFCLARLGSSQIDNLVSHMLARRVLAVPSGFVWSRVRTPIAAAVVMGAGIGALLYFRGERNLVWMGIVVLAGGLLYAGTLRLIDAKTFAWAWRALQGVLSRKPQILVSS